MSLSKTEFKNLTTTKETDYGIFYETKTAICKYGQAYKTPSIENYLKYYYPMYLKDVEEKKLTCPNCGEEITRARCYSQCVQIADIAPDGTASNYVELEVLGGDSNYECENCCEDITGLIKEY